MGYRFCCLSKAIASQGSFGPPEEESDCEEPLHRETSKNTITIVQLCKNKSIKYNLICFLISVLNDSPGKSLIKNRTYTFEAMFLQKSLNTAVIV